MSGAEIVSILSPCHCQSKLVVLILYFCLALLSGRLMWHVCISSLEERGGYFGVNSESPSGA